MSQTTTTETRRITPRMIQTLREAGVKEVPISFEAASAMIDQLPPSSGQSELLLKNGKQVPATRAEANLLIDALPATHEQRAKIAEITFGRYVPGTRGDAQTFFEQLRESRRAKSA